MRHFRIEKEGYEASVDFKATNARIGWSASVFNGSDLMGMWEGFIDSTTLGNLTAPEAIRRDIAALMDGRPSPI